MNRILVILPVLGLLAACDPATTGLSQGQMMGTLGGAAIGAAVTPHNAVQGALIGSAVGLVAGTYLGKTATGDCVYQRTDGSRFVGPCNGY